MCFAKDISGNMVMVIETKYACGNSRGTFWVLVCVCVCVCSGGWGEGESRLFSVHRSKVLQTKSNSLPWFCFAEGWKYR